MAVQNSVSEDDLDSAFRESSEFGVQYLHSIYRERIFQHIKRAARGFLNLEEMRVVYQDTLAGVIKKTQQPDFDPCGSLRMVFTIARNKTIGFRWRLKIGTGEAKEVREILLQFLPTLPERQRIVAQCFIDNFEMFRPRGMYKPPAEAVSAVTGITESVADVKNDWRYAQKKIIAHLQSLGYDFFKVE